MKTMQYQSKRHERQRYAHTRDIIDGTKGLANRSLEVYHKLVTERGWRAEQYVDRIMQTVEQILNRRET
jgi:hypothetical protein